MSSAPAPPVADATPGGPPPLPPGVQIFGLYSGVLVAQMVSTFLEHGIARYLADGPRTAAEVAEVTGLHAPSVHRMLRASTGLGFVTQDGERFGLAPLGHGLAEFPYFDWLFDLYSQFGACVATGRSGMDIAFGTELFDFIAARPEDAANLDRVMNLIHAGEKPAVADAYDFGPIGTVVDIGGGNGEFIATLLSRYPHLRGVLFDLAHVIDRGAPALAAHDGRWEAIGGSFFDGVPAGGDAYLLSHVVHDWPEDRCLRILGNCRDAMGSDGRLLLVEMVIPPGDEMHPGKMLDMVMLVANGQGQERTEAEYAELLDKAGFRLERVVPTASPVSVVEAYPR
jgi:hypothetical protein